MAPLEQAACLPPTGITQHVFGTGSCFKVVWSWVPAFLPARNKAIWSDQRTCPGAVLEPENLREAQAVRTGPGNCLSPAIQAELETVSGQSPDSLEGRKGLRVKEVGQSHRNLNAPAWGPSQANLPAHLLTESGICSVPMMTGGEKSDGETAQRQSSTRAALHACARPPTSQPQGDSRLCLGWSTLL